MEYGEWWRFGLRLKLLCLCTDAERSEYNLIPRIRHAFGRIGISERVAGRVVTITIYFVSLSQIITYEYELGMSEQQQQQ